MKYVSIQNDGRLYRLHVEGGRATITEDGRPVWRGGVASISRAVGVPKTVALAFAGAAQPEARG